MFPIWFATVLLFLWNEKKEPRNELQSTINHDNIIRHKVCENVTLNHVEWLIPCKLFHLRNSTSFHQLKIKTKNTKLRSIAKSWKLLICSLLHPRLCISMFYQAKKYLWSKILKLIFKHKNSNALDGMRVGMNKTLKSTSFLSLSLKWSITFSDGSVFFHENTTVSCERCRMSNFKKYIDTNLYANLNKMRATTCLHIYYVKTTTSTKIRRVNGSRT